MALAVWWTVAGKQQKKKNESTRIMWFISKISFRSFGMSAYSRVNTVKGLNYSNKSPPTQSYSFEFSNEQEIIILKTINKCQASELVKYNIKGTQLKKLLSYREKNGQFKSFNDVLITQDVPSFIKFCKSILVGGKKVQGQKCNDTISKNIVVPPIYESNRCLMKSVLGLHVLGNTLSWASLESNGRVDQWDCDKYDDSSKLNLITLVDSILDIVSKLPHYDVYVMESDAYTPLTTLKPSAYHRHLQRQQVIAIIIGIMKMRRGIDSDNKRDLELHNCFHMMQPRSAAKLFKLNLGNETISAQGVVKNIISSQDTLNLPGLPLIRINPQIIDKYNSQDYSTREQLNSVLLLTLAFSNHICLKTNTLNPIECPKNS